MQCGALQLLVVSAGLGVLCLGCWPLWRVPSTLFIRSRTDYFPIYLGPALQIFFKSQMHLCCQKQLFVIVVMTLWLGRKKPSVHTPAAVLGAVLVGKGQAEASGF